MSIIYQPSGKAREYSPLAANLYSGCNHACKYCYAPAIRRKTREVYTTPEPRRDIVKLFENDCRRNYKSEQPVFFCFMTDPYNEKEKELRITRECIKIAMKHKIPINILTKSKSVLNDIDLFIKHKENISIGFTLTFDNDEDSKEWEPNASFPRERIEVLQILKEKNIKTWASFEPVIIPKQSFEMMVEAIPYVDLLKIGKINNYKGLDKQIDWNKFLIESCKLLRGANKNFYIKHDLRLFANGFKLFGNEINMDEFIKGWEE